MEGSGVNKEELCESTNNTNWESNLTKRLSIVQYHTRFHEEGSYLIAASPHCSAISSKTQMATRLSSGVRSFPCPPKGNQKLLETCTYTDQLCNRQTRQRCNRHLLRGSHHDAFRKLKEEILPAWGSCMESILRSTVRRLSWKFWSRIRDTLPPELYQRHKLKCMVGQSFHVKVHCQSVIC